MTTGTNPNIRIDTGNYEIKSYAGDDGRYDANGNMQWNKYEMTYTKHVATKGNLGFYAGCGVIPPSFDPNLQIKTLNKLVDKVKGHSFNLAVASVESRQTIRLIKDTLLSVGRAALDVKHGRFSVAIERLLNNPAVRNRLTPARRGSLTRLASVTRREASLKDVSQKWLELQYGWLPLISDVHEGMKALESRVNRNRPFETRSTSVNSNGSWDSSESSLNYTNIGNYIESCTITNRAILLSSSLPSEVGLEDPLTVAWEIVPFSFVADWFIPIGSYLTAVNQVPRVLSTLMISRFQKGKAHNLRLSGNNHNYDNCTTAFDFANLDRKVVAAGDHFFPAPQFKTLEKAASPLHIVNAISLLTVLLSSDTNRSARFNPIGF